MAAIARRVGVPLWLALVMSACGGGSEPATKTPSPTPAEPGGPSATVACDADNGGITLPAGFCATTFADHVGTARHIAVTSSGDVYVMLSAGAILRVVVRARRGGQEPGRDPDADA